MSASVLSLCSGYGGLDLAVEAVTGARTRWVAEIDRDASAVLAARFPDAENLGDLKQIDWSAYAGQVDVLTAGYPCQPFSTAGRRLGTDDPRHLWPWVADAIRLVRPRLVVLENVAGHLVLGFDAVLADLAEMGMSARWGIVRASDAGAPHRRERLFVVAHASGVGCEGVAGNGTVSSARQVDGASEQCVVADADRFTTGRVSGTALGPQAAHVGRGQPHVDHGPADGVRGVAADATVADGRAAQLDGVAASRRPAAESGERHRNAAADTDGTARHATGCPGGAVHESCTVERSRRCSGVDDDTTDWGRFAPAIGRWERHMGRTAPAPLVVGTRQLNARLVEWMMGLPDGWVTDIIPNRRALKVLGNGVVPQQAALALGALL